MENQKQLAESADQARETSFDYEKPAVDKMILHNVVATGGSRYGSDGADTYYV